MALRLYPLPRPYYLEGVTNICHDLECAVLYSTCTVLVSGISIVSFSGSIFCLFCTVSHKTHMLNDHHSSMFCSI